MLAAAGIGREPEKRADEWTAAEAHAEALKKSPGIARSTVIRHLERAVHDGHLKARQVRAPGVRNVVTVWSIAKD